MISSRVLQLLFLLSSITSQALIKGMLVEKKEIIEGIAQKIEALPKELQYKIFSFSLALRENPKYELYKKLDVGSKVTGIALNGDNTRALTGSKDMVARIWDVENGTVIKELKGHTTAILSMALSADGRIALTCSCDRTPRVWNMSTGQLLKTLQVGSRVSSVTLSGDGALALTGSNDGIVRLCHTSTGELLQVLKGHTYGILSVALSADGTLALTGSYDGTARVWNMSTGELLQTLQVGPAVISVALSGDGTIALTGTDNNTQVWDAKSGTLVNTLLIARFGYSNSVTLSNDGKRALVSTNDKTIQVWNTKLLPGQKETSTPLTVLAGHTDSVIAVAFGGADFIASGSDDGTVLIWKPFALEPRGPQEHEEVLRQAYKETFSRPKFLFPNEKETNLR